MDLIADSQSILWLLGAPEKLSDRALSALREAEDAGGIGVSITSVFDLWYATHKRGPTRVEVPDFELVKSTLGRPSGTSMSLSSPREPCRTSTSARRPT